MSEAKAIAAVVRDYFARAVEPINKRIDELLEKISQIPAGPPGLNGKDGADGVNGKDGLPGRDGEPGIAGKDGAPGKDGEEGKQGERGADGAPGEKGADGKDGKDGRDGRDGKDGLPGKDASNIEYLDGIDESKSYVRGTHALYHGGVIVALRATDPVDGDLLKAGWGVAMNGIHNESEESLDEGRTLKRTTVYTNGKSVIVERKSAVMLYRNVWRHDAEYERGDVVTLDGSAWHCEVEKTGERPGASSHWKLCVKRGTAGKDGKDGARGEKGLDGAPGRDAIRR